MCILQYLVVSLSGRQGCSRTWTCLSHFLFAGLVTRKDLGDSRDLNTSVVSELPCLECGKVSLATRGILCANYSFTRGRFGPCKGFWCPGCYCVPAELNQFPIKKAFDMGPEGVIAEDPKDKGRFLTARAGDHLMHEFQCDLCHFRNIQMVEPAERVHAGDALLLECIRRCNLDALWSKEPTTVERNRRDFEMIISKGTALRLTSEKLFEVKRARPLSDQCSMSLATVMIYRSLDAGRNDKYVQFNTVRSMRAAAGNYWRASATKDEISVLMRGQTKLTGSSSPTNTMWYEHFMLGFHKRVGDINRPDKAVSIELMLGIVNRYEARWLAASGNRISEREVIFPALFAICAYVASLRGEEVPLMDLGQTRAKTQMGICHPDNPHVVISLSGRFKNEVGVLKYHIPVVEKTASGIDIRKWIERMLLWYGPDRKGYVFRDGVGNRVSAGHYAQSILGVIREIQQSGLKEELDLVEGDCDVFEEFGMSRSFRRGSDSRALAAGVPPATVDLINRWRTTERAKGRNAQLKMNEHYSDVRLLLELYLPYSRAL